MAYTPYAYTNNSSLLKSLLISEIRLHILKNNQQNTVPLQQIAAELLPGNILEVTVNTDSNTNRALQKIINGNRVLK